MTDQSDVAVRIVVSSFKRATNGHMAVVLNLKISNVLWDFE